MIMIGKHPVNKEVDKMKKENENEMLLLMKELVEKVKALEGAVYNKENMLMKSGFVVVNSPTPSIESNSGLPDGDTIAKMDWKEIGSMIQRIEGGY